MSDVKLKADAKAAEASAEIARLVAHAKELMRVEYGKIRRKFFP